MNLRDKILSAKDSNLAKVSVPEWECDIHVKSWSGLERVKVQSLTKSDELLARVVALSACDEAGVRLFKDEDVAALQEKNGAVLERVALAALQHNGIGKEAIAEAKNS
jgi:hypothetical protein